MKSYWNYKDSLDLEFFLKQDAEQPDGVLHERDRRLYLEDIEPGLSPNSPPQPSFILRKWLQLRRSSLSADSRLPGNIAEEVYTLLKLVFSFTGFISGCTAGLVYFSYSGETPVNVLPFLAFFVISQLGLALLVFLRQTISRLAARSIPRSLAVLLLSTLTVKGYRRLVKQVRHSMSAEHYNTLTAAVGRGRGLHTLHGRIFYWPMFLVLQLTGICFNLGLLGTSLLKVTVSDIAFGWQSTLQVSARTLHSFTQWLSLPWSWFMEEGVGFPTLADIEGSRIILKEGISHLMTENLISWWPFLLMCLLTYGLLVRLLFFFYGKYQENSVSASFEITTPAVNQVLRRMQTPLVTTQAQPELTAATAQQNAPEPLAPLEADAAPLQTVAVLLPDECFDSCSTDELSLLLAREGCSLGEIYRFQEDYRSDQDILQNLAVSSGENPAGIVIIMEAWMPPLVGFLSFLQDMRKKTGPSLPITVRLIGKPTAKTALTPVTDVLQTQIWKKKIESLGDPYLAISPLLEQDSK